MSERALRAHVRYLGRGKYSGYVEDSGHIFICECPHDHRSARTAQACADRETRRRYRARRSKGGSPR